MPHQSADSHQKGHPLSNCCFCLVCPSIPKRVAISHSLQKILEAVAEICYTIVLFFFKVYNKKGTEYLVHERQLSVLFSFLFHFRFLFFLYKTSNNRCSVGLCKLDVESGNKIHNIQQHIQWLLYKQEELGKCLAMLLNNFVFASAHQKLCSFVSSKTV